MRSSPARSPAQSSSPAGSAVAVALCAVSSSLCVLHADMPRFRLPSVSRRPVTVCHIVAPRHGSPWCCLRSPPPMRHRPHPLTPKPLRLQPAPRGGPAPDLPVWGQSRPSDPQVWSLPGSRPGHVRPGRSGC
ncbi:hypothetical protein NDU88_003081 [Pleurodeles waltl]|uniref:Secreted protein n=1 Tax=Pleurodeles waltl TaxID=8319 RepID=A0AAV7NH84_PLEWA|nr:hypothetical protein NDU88_003081 [Pleurodeles waltl]